MTWTDILLLYAAVVVGQFTAGFIEAAWDDLTGKRDAEYRLSRARAAAHYYRRAAIHFANRTGSAADVDEVAATAAACGSDDLTAADLRREAGAPDTRDT